MKWVSAAVSAMSWSAAADGLFLAALVSSLAWLVYLARVFDRE